MVDGIESILENAFAFQDPLGSYILLYTYSIPDSELASSCWSKFMSLSGSMVRLVTEYIPHFTTSVSQNVSDNARNRHHFTTNTVHGLIELQNYFGKKYCGHRRLYWIGVDL